MRALDQKNARVLDDDGANADQGNFGEFAFHERIAGARFSADYSCGARGAAVKLALDRTAGAAVFRLILQRNCGGVTPRDSRWDGGVTYIPVPLSLTFCGLVVALSLMFSVAGRAPVAFGEKVTLMVHFAAAARLVPQLLVCA